MIDAAPNRLIRALSIAAPGYASGAFADDGSAPAGSVWVLALTIAILLGVGAVVFRRIVAGTDRWPTLSRRRNESREVFEALLDMTCDWHWSTDTVHRYTHISEGFRRQTGLDPELLIGRRPWELIWDGAGDDYWSKYKRHLGRRDQVSLILARRGPDGQLRHIEMLGRPLYRGKLFLGYHGIGREVTERVNTERALLESQQRYHDVVESVNEVIFQTDAQGRLTFLNGVWRRITGYRVERSLGRPLTDFLHPDDRAGVESVFSQVAAGVLPECSSQLRLRTRTGEIRWIEAAGRPIKGANGVRRGVAGTLDDISARKVAELTLKNVNQELEARVRLRTAELEASNRELEAFSYSVSHDLRAPLRAIDGFARILEEELDGQLTSAALGYLERIRRATQRMAHLIDALIELARLTRQPLRKERVDLSEMALQIIDELRSEEPARNVEVEITRELVVTADRVLARGLLENLLRNAWKYSAGQAVAKIRFGVEMNNDRRIFCIEDNGAGFDMAFATNLFRPFSRLHSNTEFDGTGIGLATVQRIIQRHGGAIWAEAEPGHGARFFFTLGH